LSRFEGTKIDGITIRVGTHTKNFLSLFHVSLGVEVDDVVGYIRLFYHDKFVARLIEGCNSISVIILFASFIIAFSGKFKTTVFYIVFGALVIYVLNIVRIALLSVLLYHYPAYESFLHEILFPLFIYSVVFLLWFVWVNKFSTYAKVR
jgi:exosortase family protein XrtF